MLIPSTSLMELVELKEKYPNYMELGKEVRKYINDNKKLIEQYLKDTQG